MGGGVNRTAGAGRDRQFVTALARGLAILRCFSHERPSMSCSELARQVGLPRPTVWRLCHTLLREGYLSCDETTGKLSAGLSVLALGYSALARQSLAEIALPRMEAITRRTHLGMSLAVRDGCEMVYLQRTHGDFMYLNDPVGARRPFAQAPTGLACFALYGDEERAVVSEALQAACPAQWPQLSGKLAQAVADYQRSGAVFCIGTLHGQLNVVAVPFRCQGAGKVYGLSAAGLAAEWPRERLATIGDELVVLGRELAMVRG